MNFEKQKLSDFLKLLGSQAGAPGGGAAAALAGAVGCAMIEMVSRLNDAKLHKNSGNAQRAALIRGKFQRLMSEDAKAFQKIQKIYKFRKLKKGAWQKALKSGATVPLVMAKMSAAAGPLITAEKNRTSPWLESDRKEAAIFLRTALDAAELNVKVNLKEINDPAFCKKAQREMRQWRRKLQKY